MLLQFGEIKSNTVYIIVRGMMKEYDGEGLRRSIRGFAEMDNVLVQLDLSEVASIDDVSFTAFVRDWEVDFPTGKIELLDTPQFLIDQLADNHCDAVQKCLIETRVDTSPG